MAARGGERQHRCGEELEQERIGAEQHRAAS
jgi:hypothetical protein